jgi:hypothetical protein
MTHWLWVKRTKPGRESGRGCPYGCEFCTVTGFTGNPLGGHGLLHQRLERQQPSIWGQILAAEIKRPRTPKTPTRPTGRRTTSRSISRLPPETRWRDPWRVVVITDARPSPSRRGLKQDLDEGADSSLAGCKTVPIEKGTETRRRSRESTKR